MYLAMKTAGHGLAVARPAPLRRRASALTGQGDQAAARRAPLCRRASALTGQGDQAAARRAPLC